jgi:hypothetical protein
MWALAVPIGDGIDTSVTFGATGNVIENFPSGDRYSLQLRLLKSVFLCFKRVGIARKAARQTRARPTPILTRSGEPEAARAGGGM